MSATHDKMLDQTASTKKSTRVAGKSGAPATYLTGVKCSRPFPVDPEIRRRLALESAHEVWSVFTENADIREGHFFVYAGTDYPIRSVANWPFADETHLALVLEELKA